MLEAPLRLGLDDPPGGLQFPPQRGWENAQPLKDVSGRS